MSCFFRLSRARSFDGEKSAHVTMLLVFDFHSDLFSSIYRMQWFWETSSFRLVLVSGLDLDLHLVLVLRRTSLPAVSTSLSGHLCPPPRGQWGRGFGGKAGQAPIFFLDPLFSIFQLFLFSSVMSTSYFFLLRKENYNMTPPPAKRGGGDDVFFGRSSSRKTTGRTNCNIIPNQPHTLTK